MGYMESMGQRAKTRVVTVREELLDLIGRLPDESLPGLREMAAFEALLANAPEDDEPTTAEDLAAIAESRAEIKRGEFVALDDVEATLHG